MIRRRQFLFASTTLLGTGALVYYAIKPDDPVTPAVASGKLQLNSTLGEGMDALLLSLTGTDALGAVWMSQPWLPDRSALISHFNFARGQPFAQLVPLMHQRIQRDYRGSKLCQLDGWTFSESECYLIGLRYQLLREVQGQVALLASQEQVLKPQAPADYTEGHIAELEDWGPRYTLLGERVNVQLDGHSGLWFKMAAVPAHAKIMIDGEIAKTSVSDKVVTSGLFAEQQNRILATAGRYEIALIDPVRGLRQHLAYFEVRDPAQPVAADVSCEIENWGPRRSPLGTLANQQPDGSLGVWVKADCLPPDTRLMVGDDLVPSGVRKPGLTGAIPSALLAQPGILQLYLFSADTQWRIPLGELVLAE
ncbi:MAG: hypothetical protein ACK5ME_13160 [Parahaliea sp.]